METEQMALLVIDLQHGFFNMKPAIFRGDELLLTAHDLVRRARDADIPVIWVQHVKPEEDPDDPDLAIHPSLEPLSHETVIRKHMPDAFYQTELQDMLTELGTQKLVITGLQTEYCVDTTSRRACSLDYDVTVVSDGHSTWDTADLAATEIIAHHNRILGDWFADLRAASEIDFGDRDVEN